MKLTKPAPVRMDAVFAAYPECSVRPTNLRSQCFPFKAAIIRDLLREGYGELPDRCHREVQAASITKERVTLLSEFSLRDRRTFWIMRCLNNRPCSANLHVTYY